MKILIVDDNKHLLELLALNAELGGHKPVTKNNMAEALVYFEQNSVDAMMVDYHFEGKKMTGNDFITICKNKKKDIFALLMTGSVSRNTIYKEPHSWDMVIDKLDLSRNTFEVIVNAINKKEKE